MPATALWEVQKGVKNRLSNDATLSGLVSGVFDDVENAAYPYIVVGDATESPLDAFGGRGHENTLTLHIWSQYEGFKEALTILDRINTLLDRYALTVTGFATVRCIYEFSETLRDPDGITRHVPVRYRVQVQST